MIRRLLVSVALRFGPALLASIWTCPALLWGDDQVPAQRDVPPAAALLRWLTSGTPSAQDAEYPATHRQTATLKVLESDERDKQVASFCLDQHGHLLVAVQSDPGEVRVMSPAGQRLASWTLPIRPEAINVSSGGGILVAGGGRILQLDSEGSILLDQPVPHVAAFQQDREALRAQVIANLKSAAESYKRMLTRFEDQVDRLLANALEPDERQESELLQERLAKLEKQPKEERNWYQKRAIRQRRRLVEELAAQAEQRLDTTSQQHLKMLRQQITTYRQVLADSGGDTPSEQQIESALDKMIAYKSRISSISRADEDVFLATGAVKGYGYDVWRLDTEFSQAEKIITGLRGCCGQMDVKASSEGIFVAENSRHRVGRFDREGNRLTIWGRRDKRGVKGFGGCCNPMNVALRRDGSVYTAESTTGRIKHYRPDGQLVALVGAVELVPGCKNVSIAVSDDGSRVYMLDITRNHINVMESLAETAEASADEMESDSDPTTDDVTANETP